MRHETRQPPKEMQASVQLQDGVKTWKREQDEQKWLSECTPRPSSNAPARHSAYSRLPPGSSASTHSYPYVILVWRVRRVESLNNEHLRMRNRQSQRLMRVPDTYTRRLPNNENARERRHAQYLLGVVKSMCVCTRERKALMSCLLKKNQCVQLCILQEKNISNFVDLELLDTRGNKKNGYGHV